MLAESRESPAALARKRPGVNYARKWLFVVRRLRKLPKLLYFMGIVVTHPKDSAEARGECVE